MLTLEPPEQLIQKGKKHFQAHQLDQALDVMNESLLYSQLQEGAELPFYGQLLWIDILITKGRFSGDVSYAKLALHKLEEVSSLLPPYVSNNAPNPLHLLSAQGHFQLGNLEQAQKVANQFLLISETNQDFSGKIQAYNTLSLLALEAFELNKALAFARKGQELLLEHTDKTTAQVLADNYERLSAIFLAKEDYEQSKTYAEKLHLLVDTKKELQEYAIKANLLLGQINIKLQQYDVAMAQLVKAKKESQQIQQNRLYVECTIHIGVLYTKVTSYHKAIANFEHLQTQYTAILKNTNQKYLCYTAWGKALYATNQLIAAEAQFNQIVDAATVKKYKATIVTSLAYLSSIQTTKKNFKKALMLAKRANNIIEQEGTDIEGLQVNLINLGNIHYQLGKYSEAVKLTSRGITAAKRLKDELSEIKGYQVMSNIFRKQKDYKNALLYQTIYSKFFEDFFLRNDRQRISSIEQQSIIEDLREELQRVKNEE